MRRLCSSLVVLVRPCLTVSITESGGEVILGHLNCLIGSFLAASIDVDPYEKFKITK